MFNFLQNKNPSCSLDLGSTWAKTVRLARKGREPRLDRVARIAWSPSEHKDFQSKGQRIKQAWGQLSLRDKYVISSLAGHSVIVKRVFFEKSASGDLESKINEEAGQYIPFDISAVHLDYHILEPDPESENQEVILVASKKKVVQDLAQVMEHSGLGLSIVDVDAFALSNCFEFNYPELTSQPAYLLDIGGQHSIFAVFWENQPLFFREMSFGGKQLTDVIATALEVDTSRAEALKLQGPEALSRQDRSRIDSECSRIMRTWASEIKRLVSFYQTSVPAVKQAAILLLSGGGSLFNGVGNTLEEELQLETRHMDPWKNVEIKSNDFDLKYLESVKPQFCVPTGLALRGFI